MLTFLRWVYLCLAGIGNHVLLDEAKVTPYRHLVRSGVRTLYHQALRRSSLALRGAWPVLHPLCPRMAQSCKAVLAGPQSFPHPLIDLLGDLLFRWHIGHAEVLDVGALLLMYKAAIFGGISNAAVAYNPRLFGVLALTRRHVWSVRPIRRSVGR